MSKIQNALAPITAHKGVIIRRTVIVSATIIGVTLAAGLFKVKPTEEAVVLAKNVAKGAAKVARGTAKAAE